MAEHYSSAVIPGRVRHPRDKPSAENEVWQATKALVGGWRDASFDSLDELNREIRLWLDAYGDEPFQKRDGTRRSVFESEEKPLMIPLPVTRYEVCVWACGRKVQPNCHVQYRGNWYSAPADCVGRRVDLKVSDHTLEVWAGQRRASSHRLFADNERGKWSTNRGDVPPGHEWQP